mgnify:FL=1|tara:strand:+ start:376 stop:792 length:417 start_codon:yes stop_codon:yes gene_type:complete
MQTKQYLGYLGLAPFGLTLIFEKTTTEILTISANQVFIFYSAIILSFIAGTLWRKQNDTLSIKLQLASNLFSLLAFFALLMPENLALIILAVSYVVVLIFEYAIEQIKHDNTHYLTMRLHLTTMVVLLHVIAFISWGM